MPSILGMKPGKDRMVTLDELERRPDPAPMGPKHHPVRYDDAVHRIIDSMSTVQMTAGKMELALCRQESLLLALIEIGAETINGLEVQHQMALMMSEAQAVGFKLCAGTITMLCTNLALSGSETIVSAKQTIHANILDKAVIGGIAQFAFQHRAFGSKMKQLSENHITDDEARVITYEVMEKGILPPSKFHEIDQWYFKDAQADTESRTQWGIYNSMTRALRSTPSLTRVEQTKELGRYFNI